MTSSARLRSGHDQATLPPTSRARLRPAVLEPAVLPVTVGFYPDGTPAKSSLTRGEAAQLTSSRRDCHTWSRASPCSTATLEVDASARVA